MKPQVRVYLLYQSIPSGFFYEQEAAFPILEDGVQNPVSLVAQIGNAKVLL